MGNRRVSMISLGVGLTAAGIGAVAGLAAERAASGRPLLHHGPPDIGEGFGTLRGEPHVVQASDGTLLHAEVDDAAEAGEHVPTVVFCHGYGLNLDSWHYQRAALRGRYRLVLWDQRGHGRSRRGPVDSATIDQVGDDLSKVLDELAPAGPLVLVGHSMGGMTVMSLAAHRPEDFAQRVVAVALVATSAGDLSSHDFGLSWGRLVNRLGAPALGLLTKRADLIERTRRLGSDLEQLFVRRWSYASPVSTELVRFTADMIASTRIEVVADFFPAFGSHDKREALSTLDGRELLVLVGDSDLLTPPEHSEDIVQALPGAEHVVVTDAGHLVMLEHPTVVTEHLLALIERGVRVVAAQAAPQARRRGTRTLVTDLAARRRLRRESA